MKTIILAAGAGTRLGDKDLPKPLTLLSNGQSILETQLTNLSKCVSLKDIIIVVGFHKEQIIDKFPKMHFIMNTEYAEENTSKSLLRAIQTVEEDILWLNGDVIFHPSVLKAILHSKRNSMIVNTGETDDEGVKYRTNSQGKIIEVSKTVKEAQGEALGINYFTKTDLNAFKRNLEKCKKNDYFEKAIEMCIEESVPVWSVPVKNNACTEVDFPEDLIRANKLITLWSQTIEEG